MGTFGKWGPTGPSGRCAPLPPPCPTCPKDPLLQEAVPVTVQIRGIRAAHKTWCGFFAWWLCCCGLLRHWPNFCFGCLGAGLLRFAALFAFTASTSVALCAFTVCTNSLVDFMVCAHGCFVDGAGLAVATPWKGTLQRDANNGPRIMHCCGDPLNQVLEGNRTPCRW